MEFVLYPQEAAILTGYNQIERRISIYTDTDHGAITLQSIADQIGLKTISVSSIENGVENINEFATGDAILIDMRHAEMPASDIFFDRVEKLCRDDGVPVLVNCTAEGLDAISILLGAPSVSLMCDATAADWIAALAMLEVRGAPTLHDAAMDETIRLQRLAEEVQRIARTLSDLVAPGAPPLSGVSDAVTGFRAPSTPYTPRLVPITAADVRMIIRLRRMRDRYFRSDLFADPAWDMLLDLMAARMEGSRVAVSSLCIAAAVPPTTALRWIKTMCDNGMFIRVADPEDGRRIFIELSDNVAAELTSYLGAAKAQGGLAV